ncbi:MAG: nicotinamide-nucleotide amidohydrolase family protein [Alphaproteobacteria bacterium]|nr:nicotinamide-nucleotide amidohydrolase family protein [Alphaproteobacteria bacterium]
MSPFDPTLAARATEFVAACTRAQLTLAVAESCTGGLLAGLITAVPGSSAVLQLGVVAYADAAKSGVLQVPKSALGHGAVSAQVALAMAEAVLRLGRAELAAAITGIAGPGGGSEAKPVGLVYIAAVRRGRPANAQRFLFGERGRSQVRAASVSAALSMLEALLQAS